MLRHAWVVGAVAALPLVAPHSAIRFAAAPQVVVVDGGDAIPVSATTGYTLALSLPTRPAQTVEVHPGDTLASLATAFHADVSAMRWANSIPENATLVPGTPVLVPPGAGALVRVNHNERPSHFAARLGLDARVILDYNALHRDSVQADGTYLQVPVEAQIAGALLSSSVVPISPGTPAVGAAQHWKNPGTPSNGLFPWGQCTWYVATQRVVTWTGNAADWFRNAQAAHRPEGRTPVQGAIAVIATNWVGHVAYVERVNPDGSFVISEEHFPGLGVRDERTVTVSTLDLVGFIY